jgi:transposase InsO family protein
MTCPLWVGSNSSNAARVRARANARPAILRQLTSVVGPRQERICVADAMTQLAAKHIFIRPHCPWQNGKVERLNRTLQTEWAYRQVFTSNTERTNALAPWIEYYNTRRRHSALGGLPPISRLSPT